MNTNKFDLKLNILDNQQIMIEATPQLLVDLTSRYEQNALQKSDLEYAAYFLGLFEGHLIFEYTGIKKNQLNTHKYFCLSVRTSEGVYMNESDLIYFLQIKLNQIMKDFGNDKLMRDSVYKHCYDKKKKIIIPDFKTPTDKTKIESWVRSINAQVERGVVPLGIPDQELHKYPELYAEAEAIAQARRLSGLRASRWRTAWQPPMITWEQVKPYINQTPLPRVKCPCGYCESPMSLCNAFMICIARWSQVSPVVIADCLYKNSSLLDNAQHGGYTKSVNGGMTGEFKYKFKKMNDIYQFIDHIGKFIRSKNKWG
jgi:hypothetical protein